MQYFEQLQGLGVPIVLMYALILGVPLIIGVLILRMFGITLMQVWRTFKYSVWVIAIVYPFVLTAAMIAFFGYMPGYTPSPESMNLQFEFAMHVLMIYIAAQIAIIGFAENQSTESMWFDMVRSLIPMGVLLYIAFDAFNSWGLSDFQWRIIRIAMIPVVVDGVLMIKVLLRLSRRYWGDQPGGSPG